MAVSAKLYTKFFQSALNKEIDLDTDVIKVMLCTATYTPAQTTHQYKSSVTNEVSGTGYTAGGATLASVTNATSSTTWTFDAADTSWTTSTITARYAVVYDSSPATDATRPLICWVDFGADVSSTAATFTITWDATGIASVVVA
jgi:hypothetical protein